MTHTVSYYKKYTEFSTILKFDVHQVNIDRDTSIQKLQN